MKLSILAGATSQSINVFIRDSSSTTGAGLSGLVFNSAGLIAYYSFAGANATSVAITLATLAAVNSAWSSGGFKEIDATNMKGWYRLDLPNAAIASAKGRSVALLLSGATNMAPCPIEIELTGWDNQDATAGGISRIDAAVSSRMATFTLPTNFSSFAITAGGAVTVGTNNDKTGYGLSSTESLTLQTGTAQAGTSTSVTLAAGASSVTDFYKGAVLRFVSGTGAGQSTRVITGYNGTTKVATVARAFATTPDATTVYVVQAEQSPVLDTNLAVTAGTVSDKTGYSLTVSPPTAAQVATAVWQDTTAGDFTVASSIGKSLYTSGNAPGAASGLALVGSNMGSVSSVSSGVTVTTNNDKTGYSLTVSPPTAAAIATAVWQDTTAGDFTVANSIGKSLGGSFTALGNSVFTIAALANAPSGGAGSDPLNNALGSYASGTAGGALQLLTVATVVTSSPVGPSGSISLDHATDYLASINRAVAVGVAGVISDLTGWTPVLTAWDENGNTVLTSTGTVTVATGSTQAVQFEFTKTQLGITPRPQTGLPAYEYKIEATKTGSLVRLRFGKLTITPDV